MIFEFLRNVHRNEVERRSLSSPVVFFKFPGRYFVELRSYLIQTFTGILSRGLVDPWA